LYGCHKFKRWPVIERMKLSFVGRSQDLDQPSNFILFAWQAPITRSKAYLKLRDKAALLTL
jgi:hypothetical protein